MYRLSPFGRVKYFRAWVKAGACNYSNCCHTSLLSCDKNIIFTEKNVSLQEMCHYKAVILILSYFSLRSWQDFVREGIG